MKLPLVALNATMSDKTGREGRDQKLGARISIVWTLFRALGPAKENIYALESPKGYMVLGYWELKWKFQVRSLRARSLHSGYRIPTGISEIPGRLIDIDCNVGHRFVLGQAPRDVNCRLRTARLAPQPIVKIALLGDESKTAVYPHEEAVRLALTITDLSKTYPNGVKALKNLSLTIGNNMFGLLGANGAGKSTLMRIVATLQDPDSGSVYFDNINVLKEKDAIRKLLGYLPQEFGVYPKLSAADMLAHLAVLKGVTSRSERRDMVDALLKQTNLWEARKKALSTYSGGMKQRFGIAQALLADPKLIIVDEPTAGLDPAERKRFLNLLG